MKIRIECFFSRFKDAASCAPASPAPYIATFLILFDFLLFIKIIFLNKIVIWLEIVVKISVKIKSELIVIFMDINKLTIRPNANTTRIFLNRFWKIEFVPIYLTIPLWINYFVIAIFRMYNQIKYMFHNKAPRNVYSSL